MNRLQYDNYDDKDVEEILKRALTIDAAKGGSRTEIMRAAAELGISEEAVYEAERQYMIDKKERDELQEFIRDHKRGYWEHVATYLVVNVFLVAINLLNWGGHFWAIYPLLGWGIGLAVHSISTFNHKSEEFQKEFDKWRQRRKERESGLLPSDQS